MQAKRELDERNEEIDYGPHEDGASARKDSSAPKLIKVRTAQSRSAPFGRGYWLSAWSGPWSWSGTGVQESSGLNNSILLNSSRVLIPKSFW